MFDLGAYVRENADTDLAAHIGANLAAIVPAEVMVNRLEDGRIAPEAIVCEVPNGHGGIRRIISPVIDESRLQVANDLAARLAHLRAHTSV